MGRSKWERRVAELGKMREGKGRVVFAPAICKSFRRHWSDARQLLPRPFFKQNTLNSASCKTKNVVDTV